MALSHFLTHLKVSPNSEMSNVCRLEDGWRRVSLLHPWLLRKQALNRNSLNKWGMDWIRTSKSQCVYLRMALEVWFFLFQQDQWEKCNQKLLSSQGIWFHGSFLISCSRSSISTQNVLYQRPWKATTENNGMWVIPLSLEVLMKFLITKNPGNPSFLWTTMPPTTEPSDESGHFLPGTPSVRLKVAKRSCFGVSGVLQIDCRWFYDLLTNDGLVTEGLLV